MLFVTIGCCYCRYSGCTRAFFCWLRWSANSLYTSTHNGRKKTSSLLARLFFFWRTLFSRKLYLTNRARLSLSLSLSLLVAVITTIPMYFSLSETSYNEKILTWVKVVFLQDDLNVSRVVLLSSVGATLAGHCSGSWSISWRLWIHVVVKMRDTNFFMII